MHISRTLLLAAVSPLALTAALAPTAYAAPKADRVITVMGGNAVLGINDNTQPGSTPGDVRTISLTLTNLKGQPAGHADVVQTLTRQQGNIGTAIKVVVLTLPRGTITASGVAEFADFTSTTGRPNDKSESLAIIGGTKAYRGASGELDIEVLPAFKSKWIIKLDR